MSDEKVLTKEIVEQFLSDEDSVDLWEFTTIEDAAAESLSKHKDYLHLNGLTSLSDTAAESLSKHKGDLRLGGLTTLSDAAAESLSEHRGKLKTNAKIEALIAATSATLTPAQRKKIKTLITVEHLSTACELLKSANADEGDWLAVFSKSRIKSLVNTWDAGTWNTLVAEMQPFPKVYELLKTAIKKRINYEGSDPSVYWRFGQSLDSVIAETSDDLTALIRGLLFSGVKDCISSRLEPRR